MTLSEKDERINNGVINIGGKYNNLKQKGRTDTQWGNQHFLLKVIVLFTNVDYPIVCPFVFFT
jgi:hypothetical protein